MDVIRYLSNRRQRKINVVSVIYICWHGSVLGELVLYFSLFLFGFQWVSALYILFISCKHALSLLVQ